MSLLSFTTVLMPVLFALSPALAAIDPYAPAPAGPFGELSKLNRAADRQPTPAKTAATTASVGSAASAPLKNIDAFNCADLRRAAMKLSVHSSNLANQNTTRTPEGGPYKRMDVICRVANGAFCELRKSDETRSSYLPTHPDADPQGYVKFPVVNASAEWAGANAAATELRLLSGQGVCGAKALEQGTAMIIKYNSDFDVISDTFAFKSDGHVSTWSRITRDGKAQSVAFKDDGTVIGQ